MSLKEFETVGFDFSDDVSDEETEDEKSDEGDDFVTKDDDDN